MEPVFFGIKRVHLRTVAITRRLLEPSLLTPARFDMMRIVAAREGGILQRNIEYLLGVSAATVSRMLTALERLGAVVRSRWERDRRCQMVEVTAIGTELVGRGFAETLDPRITEHMAATMVADRKNPDIDAEDVRAAVASFEDGLVRARRRLRDPSRVRHPWGAHDILHMANAALVPDAGPPPLFHPTYLPHEEHFITGAGRALAWDPPRGYVPPPPESYGLLPSPEDLGRRSRRPTDHPAHREKLRAAAADLAT
ncbi:MAG: hypothetical protein JWP97_4641 [Labilithrix sp.]|nr:hypothetical protein [Labilithrix sp.]